MNTHGTPSYQVKLSQGGSQGEEKNGGHFNCNPWPRLTISSSGCLCNFIPLNKRWGKVPSSLQPAHAHDQFLTSWESGACQGLSCAFSFVEHGVQSDANTLTLLHGNTPPTWSIHPLRGVWLPMYTYTTHSAPKLICYHLTTPQMAVLMSSGGEWFASGLNLSGHATTIYIIIYFPFGHSHQKLVGFWRSRKFALGAGC